MTGFRWPCGVVLWVGALVLSVAASAADSAATGPPAREVSVSPDSFVRGAPVPAWVQRVAVLPSRRNDPVVFRLFDEQIRVSDGSTQFSEIAIQVNESSALGAIGQFQFSYVPQYQKLQLHQIHILRGTQTLDRTATADLRFLERETGLERGIYSGEVTVAIVLQDVRVGDTLHLAVTKEGVNPVFGGIAADAWPWDLPMPVDVRRLSIIHPSERTIEWRMLGDFRTARVEPQVSEAGGMKTLRFEERDIDPVSPEPFVPDNYFEGRLLVVSEFRDWNQVARWAEALFPPIASPSTELQSLVAKFAAQPDGMSRVAAALRWVQGDVRNFAVSFGESSHRPHPPDKVLERRFGDCKDKSYLLLTLLRQMGIEAAPMLVSTRLPRMPGRTLPMPQAFDHAVVQARIDGQLMYLDPTRLPQPVPLDVLVGLDPKSLGLIASAYTRMLVAAGPPPRGTANAVDVEERFTLPALAPEGVLEAHVSFVGMPAQAMRSAWARGSQEERRKLSLSYYEKRYPGIELSADPVAEDDPMQNRLTIIGRYKVPKLARPQGDGWQVPFAVWTLRGVFSVPDSMKRSFPLMATMFPLQRRFKVVVDWPAQVSASRDPSSQTLDGLIFRAEARTAFRGNRYEHSVALATKASDVGVADLPRFVADLDKLIEITEGGVSIRKGDIAAETVSGKTAVHAAALRRARDSIDRATLSIRDKGLKGEDLADALCLRAQYLSDLEQHADAQRDMAEAMRVAPDSASIWGCQGLVFYASGDFAKADAAFTRAQTLGYDNIPMLLYRRGMARFYAGRYDDAAADFAKGSTLSTDAEENLYRQLWQVWSLQRPGRPLPAALMESAKRDATGAWPRPALALATGQMTAPEMFSLVNRLKGDERDLALAEAWFYVGQHELANGRTSQAREAFEKCQAIGVISYFEHRAAGFELARLGAGTARPGAASP